MLHMNAIGMDIHHHGAFSIQRPHGSGDWLLVIFKTDACLTVDNREIPAPPDSAVLFSPDAPQTYRSACDAYINHFLHFISTDDSSMLSCLRCDTLLQPGNIRELEELPGMLCREQVSASANRKKYIDLLLRMLLLKLADGSDGTRRFSAGAHSVGLNMLRADLYANPAIFACVEQMAARLQLSVSHFHQLYREHFGVSCYEDLLAARMNAARYYLQHTALSIREIAGLCGYENDVVFMRLFKRRTGQTPTEFRGQGNS